MNFQQIKPFVRFVQKLSLTPASSYSTVVPCDCRFFFCEEGAAEIELGGVRNRLTKRSVLLVPAGIPYRLLSPEREVRYISVNFDYTFDNSSLKLPISPIAAELFSEEMMLRQVEISDAPELSRTMFLPRVHRVENKLNRLLSAYSNKVIFYELEASAIFSQILIECLRCVRLNALNKHDSVFDNVFDFIHENCHKRLTNKEIADVFGYNPNYISDLLKISTGLSLHKYLLNVRIERSIELLEGGTLSIGEIAEECGFYDIYHFSKAFKNVTGVSPGKYRKG